MSEIETGGLNMKVREAESARVFLVRAEHDSDIIGFVTELAKKQKIESAVFTAIGALKSAKLGFYDQEKQRYLETTLGAPQEIACCIGNVSLKEGEAFVHAHAVLADQEGNVKAGHLLEGRVFAAEIHLTELVGGKISRTRDAMTGLSLWDI
jgi:predicted DNA-binding protein with PD1-like motif